MVPDGSILLFLIPVSSQSVRESAAGGRVGASLGCLVEEPSSQLFSCALGPSLGPGLGLGGGRQR